MTSPVATLNLQSRPPELTWSDGPHVSVDNRAARKTAAAVATAPVTTTRCERRRPEALLIGVT